MNTGSSVTEYVEFNPEKSGYTTYTAWDNKVAAGLKIAGIAIVVIGIICGFTFAKLPTGDLIGEDLFSASTFFMWAVASLFAGALLFGLGEVIKLQQKSVERQEMQLVYMERMDKKHLGEE